MAIPSVNVYHQMGARRKIWGSFKAEGKELQLGAQVCVPGAQTLPEQG